MPLHRGPAAVHPAGRHSASAGTSYHPPLQTGSEKPWAVAAPRLATGRSLSGFGRESVVSSGPQCPAGWMHLTIRTASRLSTSVPGTLGDVVLGVSLPDRGLWGHGRDLRRGRRLRIASASASRRRHVESGTRCDEKHWHNDASGRAKPEATDPEYDFEEDANRDEKDDGDLYRLLGRAHCYCVAPALAPQVLTETNTAWKHESPRICPALPLPQDVLGEEDNARYGNDAAKDDQTFVAAVCVTEAESHDDSTGHNDPEGPQPGSQVDVDESGDQDPGAHGQKQESKCSCITFVLFTVVHLVPPCAGCKKTWLRPVIKGELVHAPFTSYTATRLVKLQRDFRLCCHEA